jgi:Mn-dependent DtxR family transcriptional regulator
VVRLKTIEVAQRVAEIIHQTPLLTSRELATQIGVSYGSLMGVMNRMMRKGMIEVGNTKLASNHKTPVAQWRLLVPLEDIPSYFIKQKTEPRESCRGSHAVRDIGITEEDRQWMKHYRTQWQNRYLRIGQIPPPIHKFT